MHYVGRQTYIGAQHGVCLIFELEALQCRISFYVACILIYSFIEHDLTLKYLLNHKSSADGTWNEKFIAYYVRSSKPIQTLFIF